MEDIKMSDVYGVHIYQGDILVYFSDDLFMTYEEAQKVGLEVLEEIQEEIQSKKQRGLSYDTGSYNYKVVKLQVPKEYKKLLKQMEQEA